jgi:hypothetical protein
MMLEGRADDAFQEVTCAEAVPEAAGGKDQPRLLGQLRPECMNQLLAIEIQARST